MKEPFDRQAQSEICQYIVHHDTYETRRGLGDYCHKLGREFRQRLWALQGHDLWLDVGAGEGMAQLEYVPWMDGKQVAGLDRAPPLGQATCSLVSCDCRRPSLAGLAHDGRRRFLVKDGAALTLADLGGRPASLITDLYGALSYAPDFSGILSVYLGLLRPGGYLCAQLGTEGGWITSGHRLQAYVRDIRGARLIALRRAAQSTERLPGRDLVLERTAGLVEVPALELVRVRRHHPPRREYAYRGGRSCNPLAQASHLARRMHHCVARRS